ncbi:flagellar hook protein FlgE [Paenirhodobacter sp.]|uniref:flagellar hook protein FlgE n=1 Tax=Paenirhodobacter sp. TaxID=1965326 RepID=UPI003B408338
MSISSSLSAGVAGLAANSTRLATISDNIANSSTYGYKKATTEFESMVLNQNRSSGTYSAGGVIAKTGRMISENGPLVPTSNATDIAVNGRGFLPVTTSTSMANDNDDLLMTTTGSFETDKNGVLRTKSGLVLLGWPANADGKIEESTQIRDSVGGLQPVVINANQTAADPTTAITLGVTLPAEDPKPGGYTTTVEYYDNLGARQNLTINYVPSATTPNAWQMTITDPSGTTATCNLTFDSTRGSGGNLASASGGGYDAGTGNLTFNLGGDAQSPLTINIGKPGSQTPMRQLSSNYDPKGIAKNGSPVGNLSGLAIDENGYLQATYDTGFVKTLYQIPLVDMANPNGLTSLDSQTFKISAKSGSFYLWNAGDGPTGTVQGNAREGSTVDVAEELTNLIQTQRAYSSNAKVIQTVDEMLQETTNIKR